MNILFLTRRFYPEIGGVEKHVLEVSKELIKRGHQVSIITESPTPKDTGPTPSRLRRASNYHFHDQSDTYSINLKKAVKSVQANDFESKQMTILRLDLGKENFFKKFRTWFKLSKHIKIIEGSDIVHCHDVFVWYLPFRFLFPRKKVYTTFHGYETKFPPTAKAKLVRKISEELSFGNICIGDFIRKWYGTKPDYITYGGVEESQRSKVKIQKFGENRKKINILLIGRLEEDNGVRIYLEALKKIRDKGISYNLTICGDGKYRNQLEKYGRVEGFVNDLNKYIDRADFIFASSYLSIIQALARGKNVFSVFQNDLKRDYLTLSPFKKFISISNSADSLVDKLLAASGSDAKSYNDTIYASNWAKGQTWGKVASIYLTLWKL